MFKKAIFTAVLMAGMASASFAGVTISSPTNGSSVGSPVHFIASATGTYPISSMIIYVDNVQKYLVYAASLNTYVSLATGNHAVIIKSWDSHGTIYQASESISVGSSTTTTTTSTSGATNFYNIDQMAGWGSCSQCAGAGGSGPIASYYMSQAQGSPSLDGKSTKYSITGGSAYADVLWWKQLANGSNNPTLVANAHHFIYDTYFYVTSPTAVQALEFDINQFTGGKSYIFGTQCNVRAGNVWDVWDNVNSRWVSTGIYCAAPSAYTWHHVIVEAERTSTNQLHYIAITLDGSKHYINSYWAPKATSWVGITVNFQMDGNYAEQAYSTWLDKLTLSAW